MIDRKFIGLKLESVSAVAEPGLMRLFAKATGQTNPIYFDPDAAKQAGYPDLVAAPTYMQCLYASNRTEGPAWLKTMGVKLERVVHGEQHFEYFGLVFAGDRIDISGEVVDIYSKPSSGLEMIVQELRGFKQDGQRVFKLRSTTIVRNPR